MPDLNFTFELGSIIEAGARVLLILAVTFAFTWAIRRIIRKAIKARIPKIRKETAQQLAARSETLSRVVTRFFSIVTWTIALLMTLGTIGVNITAILATVGVASIAVGFAAQNIIRDYFNGFFIVIEDWYRVGEVAQIAGIAGLVVDVTMRKTILRDLNGTMHVIPNSKVDMASNLTRDWSRINLDVTVAYKEDIGRVIDVINEVCQQFKEDETWGLDMITTPAVLRVNELGNHGVTIKILGDTKPIRQWALMGELRRRLKDRFDREGIEIPWPHTKVYFGNSMEQNGSMGARNTNQKS